MDTRENLFPGDIKVYLGKSIWYTLDLKREIDEGRIFLVISSTIMNHVSCDKVLHQG